MHALTAFWSHALAAALYGGLVLWELRRGIRIGSGERMLLAAFALTGCWAWLTAVEPFSVLTASSETARNLIWVGVLYRLADMASPHERQHGVKPVYAAVAGVLGLQLVIDALPLLADVSAPEVAATLASTAIVLRLTAAAGALVLVHNLYGQAAPASRGAIRLAMLALALMWAYDLNLYTIAYFDSATARTLFEWRGLAAALTVPLFALGGARGEGWHVRLSRAATFQSLSLLAICAYFAVMAVLAAALRGSGFHWTRDAVAVLMALLTLAAIVVVPSARARGWAKVKLSKHLFEHRYDYRSEWLRFTATLGAWGPDADPLGERVIKAFTDILDSPGGMLLTLEDGGFERAAEWHWPGAAQFAEVGHDEAAAFWTAIASDGRIVDFEARRGGWDDARDAALAIPPALLAEPGAWVGVPLIHEERLVALAVLAPPDYRRALDWEDYDLLRTAGRQAASSLAEAHGQQALLAAQRFEDFNRRFAFILHDIKNLVSQLSLVARNAERHAGNPEFRADMVATLKSSVGKMNDLMLRIAPTGEARLLSPRSVELRGPLAAAIAAHHLRHEVRLSGDAGALVLADPDALEQAVGHLLHNAIDASPPLAPVSVRVNAGRDAVSIVIADEGAGMDADFVRNRLFQPFASTKPAGFGVGAFEAKSLVSAMNGRLSVDSRPGKGTRFTITLPVPLPLRKSA